MKQVYVDTPKDKVNVEDISLQKNYMIKDDDNEGGILVSLSYEGNRCKFFCFNKMSKGNHYFLGQSDGVFDCPEDAIKAAIDHGYKVFEFDHVYQIFEQFPEIQ